MYRSSVLGHLSTEECTHDPGPDPQLFGVDSEWTGCSWMDGWVDW